MTSRSLCHFSRGSSFRNGKHMIFKQYGGLPARCGKLPKIAINLFERAH
ncbi:hypothetical protein CVS40_11898 [Lucilia cuprina]|nr:hypothetical protein CVS40_11898 [Lucilia cuprina]